MRSISDFIIGLWSQDLGRHYSPCYTKGHEVSVPRSPAGLTGPLEQRNFQSYKNLHLHIQGVNNSPEDAQKFCGPAGNWIHVWISGSGSPSSPASAVHANAIRYFFCPFTLSVRMVGCTHQLQLALQEQTQWMSMFPAQQPFFPPFWLL